ncbi:esterase-like activity of phytase family protein [Paracoccus sp. 1_MG-2023]|uniref:esterase-like activity of phytase family protein n=1 Tax=unclassified Paracoccus (in: a-proteobacteria) TaxID=2688777 RepID=UPI001C0964E9|nr:MULTISPECIES: esterase-like activity of phytase family protein [unclassified Paracoccus (in: a-proteobacteria)]MBU2957749.1 esterase-like activity of phytase family protein [Paracoccus sp. C2R09]MDO6667403.1 esterase-like activity of phytase family protein [Paracoccus sp. 1_MG-2023]
MTRTILAALLATTAAAHADAPRFEAVLKGHAVLPADTLLPAPEDAPAFLQSSGKFTGEGNRRSLAEPGPGPEMPLAGQPLQGFSGIKAMGDGSYVVLTDNGFGSKKNSPDAMLFFSVVTPDFDAGSVTVDRTVFLNDPDRVIPFPIVTEATDTRYLTGADLDLEGFQLVGDHIVIGEEFGPFVIVADRETGRIVEFHETVVDGRTVMSPDNPFLQMADPASEAAEHDAKRSRGFEGFAGSVDGQTLYPLLEGPLWRDGEWETVADGRTALRILEMKAQSREWTGNSWLYPLEGADHAIGDFNMIDETRGLIIERDGGQGDAELACEGDATEGCFENPARFKRIYLIDMAGVEPGQPVHKVGHIDLLDMADPDGIARQGAREDGRFTFPFVTIEDVDIVDDSHIIVGNDNNYPFSMGRSADTQDDNELILLEVGEFLKARAE